ncbi:DNA adenine methylase [Ruminococcus flavefaciens]|uniref:DNA adenine methylase n=1 Tax=Ruminococcus flavefaciens TaxID=1265 RepID=UPI000A7B04AD|nr:DNA adenine methylase [Ruminococcus flavefaciens]
MSVTYDGLWNMLSYHKMSAADLRKYTGIAPNTMTKIRRNEEVALSVLGKICSLLGCDYGDLITYAPDDAPMLNDVGTISINNRRYLGNKYKLIPFITEVVNSHCKNVVSIADIFSGTGAVASAFTDRQIITNDLMYSNFVCNYAWFSSQPYDCSKLIGLIAGYNDLNITEENYMTRNFSNTYFSREDCAKIGYIREDIETKYKEHKLNEREKAILIMSLLYAMDRIANTCGHYDAFIQGSTFDKHLTLSMPNVSKLNNPLNQCYNEDANELVKRIEVDLMYIDPPYNSRQYCDAYHLLENVARWEKPEVYGVAKKMDRTFMKSRYCTRSAEQAFRELIDNIHARYILFSYNNMATKGNDRSNAKISDEAINEILQKKGRLQVFEESYKAFSAGKSDIKDNAERLFLCTCDR